MSKTEGRIHARIAGTGSYLPERVLTNAELATRSTPAMMDRRAHRIDSATWPRKAVHHDSPLQRRAGRWMRGVDPASRPDHRRQHTTDLYSGHRLHPQAQAGMPLPEFASIRLSGFIYALTTRQFIRVLENRPVVGAETLTRMLDWTDRGTCVLFGDGAGAVVLKADSETGILSTHMHADGGKAELLWNPVGVSVGFKPGEHNAGVRVLMTGNEVFKHAVKALDSVVEETLAANKLDKSAIDWLIPHQANLRIIRRRQAPRMRELCGPVDRHGKSSSRCRWSWTKRARALQLGQLCCWKRSAAVPGARPDPYEVRAHSPLKDG